MLDNVCNVCYTLLKSLAFTKLVLTCIPDHAYQDIMLYQ